LFDYIQAEIPILSSKLIEVRKIIEKHNIGYVLENELTSHNLSLKINEIIAIQKVEIQELKQNLLLAKKEENWETEVLKLKEIYDNLL
jgi:hypothetical protein